jgi:gluconate 2-dehydrogenase gamma chain
MDEPVNPRRKFLQTAVAGSAAAMSGGASLPGAAQAPAPTAPAEAPRGYVYLNPEEAAFVEALVDHMVPADALTPRGTDLGLNTYIDRALAGSWGKGDRLYASGPWKQGTPSQGYQLPLTPAELYRAGIAATNRHCVKAWGKPFDKIGDAQREELLKAFSEGKVAFEHGPPATVFFGIVYQTVMEGLFADPIYGGNRDKAGWRMIGFPGVVASHAQNIVKYRDKRYVVEPQGIADLS